MKTKLLFISLLFFPALAHSYVNTIEYSVPVSTADVAAGTVRAFPEFNMNIPDRIGEFYDVIVYIGMTDKSATGTDPTSFLVGVGIDAVAHSSTSVTDTYNDTGEHQSYIFISSATGYFNGNFTGTNHKVRLHTNIAVAPTNNAFAKFIITYEADPNATTRIKTVRIPVQSATASVSIGIQELGNGLTNQIPALDSYLPEASKVFRNIFAEYHVNDGNTNAAGDPQLCLQIDSETEVCDGPRDNTLVTSVYQYGQLNLSSMTTDSAHAIKARTTDATTPFNTLGLILTATYEYDHATSTEIFNSLMIAAADEDGFSGGPTNADRSQFTRSIIIDEVDPVLKQSGILFSMADGGATVIAMYAGNQTAYSSYTTVAGNYAGGKSFVHRVDTNNGFNIQRGTNTFVLNWYRTTATTLLLGSNPSGLLYLNYVSSKSAMGGGAANHAHTVMKLIQPVVPDNVYIESNSTAPVIGADNYRLQGAGYWIVNRSGVPTSTNINMTAEILSGEFGGDGWKGFYNGMLQSDPEAGVFISVSRSADAFKKYPQDPDTMLMDVESARKYRFQSPLVTTFMGYMFITYRTSTHTVTGTVSNYSGDGSGITVSLHRSDTNEHLLDTTTSAGGTFSTVWYDNTIPIYAVAREATGYIGRSENGTPGTDALDIELSCDACEPSVGGTNWGTINNATINNMTQGAP